MNFELFDEIKINQEIEQYASNGIHRDCDGVVIEINENTLTVVFLNPLNYGDYAVAQVARENVTFLGKSRFAVDWKSFLIKADKVGRRFTSVIVFNLTGITSEVGKFQPV